MPARPRRVRRALTTGGTVLALALGMAVVATAGTPPPAPSAPSPAAQGAPVALIAGGGAGDLTVLAERLREGLAARPRDARGWATLASVHVERARAAADPTAYAAADEALARAERLAPGDDLVLATAATLAAARHDFTGALATAGRALAVNAYSAQALAVRSDALTELGRYDEALVAAESADRLRPGTSTAARLSYAAELRGDLPDARRLMAAALAAAASPGERAFASTHLGELDRTAGNAVSAARHFAVALAAAPGDGAALVGTARLAAAGGDLATAERVYREVVGRLPLPEHVVELGELLEAQGRQGEAEEQYALARATAVLGRANGVSDDLETALFEADHGGAARALASAQAEWARRKDLRAADALGWALHAAGRDAEALPLLRKATSRGTPEARLWLHRGLVEAALGLGVDARTHLQRAVRLDGGAHPLLVAQARRALAAL